MKIKDFCRELNSNEEKKWVFLNATKDVRFLKPFYNYGVLTFNNYSYSAIIKFLTEVVNNNKELVAKIINKNIEDGKFPRHGCYVIIKLLEKFSLEEICELINYSFLFSLQDSIYLCDYLLKRNDIKSCEDLSIECVKSLIMSTAVEQDFDSSKKSPKSVHEYYLFEKVFKGNNFLREILSSKKIYKILKDSYINLFDEYGDLSHYLKQYIDPYKIKISQYTPTDVREIILTFMAIYMAQNSDKNDIEELLNSSIGMFVKLGLYAISINLEKYKKTFNDFIINIQNDDNFLENVFIYKYELLTIFENLSADENLLNSSGNTSKSEFKLLENNIENLINNLNANNPKSEYVKYLLLHGLKNQAKFKRQFLELKEKHGGHEIFEPKLSMSEVKVYSVKNLSPITLEELKSKSIEEQIVCWNSISQIDDKMIKQEDSVAYHENAEGFIDITKQLFEEKYSIYLTQLSKLKELKEPRIIGCFFEILSNSVKNKKVSKKYYNKIIDLINYYVENNLDIESWSFNYYSSGLLKNIIILDKNNNKKRTEAINKLLEKLIFRNKNNDEYQEDIAMAALNTASGLYWDCWFILQLHKKSISTNNIEFFETTLEQQLEKHSKNIMLYLLGSQMNYLYYNISDYSFVVKIKQYFENVNSNYKELKAFLIGFLSFITYVDVFKEFKDLIKQNYKTIELSYDVKRRLIGLIADLKFRDEFNEEGIVNEFLNDFFNEDVIEMLELSTIKSKIKIYNKDKVMDFWRNQVATLTTYDEAFLRLFNSYIPSEEILVYEDSLRKMFKLKAQGKSNSLYSHFYLEDFMKNFINLIQKTNNNAVGMVHIYNLLLDLIPSISVYEYKGNIPNLLKTILMEYSSKDYSNAKPNAKVLANIIFKTPGLIQYSYLFSEFDL